jgi:hypothetical protein
LLGDERMKYVSDEVDLGWMVGIVKWESQAELEYRVRVVSCVIIDVVDDVQKKIAISRPW